ncbi:hypothetical protein AN958_05810 [Leucoagaricus sp. SymC.cos]|nr:hypothetical protein AN958_05810 [Leucoagaricus sp. SymC.cos]
MHDLFAFIPTSPTSPRDFNKSIFYFKTRQEARQACRKIRLMLPLQYRTLVYPFTAMGSEDYKEQVMEGFRKGTICILCATIAAGMGTDIPDIVDVVIFGVDSLHDAYQKGGRAGRSANVGARMIWIVEKWAFKLEETNGKATKKNMGDERRRFAMDPAAREYINRSMSEKCMREYIVTYFRPRPNLPGFPYYSSNEKD